MVQPEIQTLLGRAKVASWIIIAAIGVFALTLVGEVLEFTGVIDLMLAHYLEAEFREARGEARGAVRCPFPPV